MVATANAIAHVSRSKKFAIYLAIFVILFLPLAIQFYTQELNEWYKKVPIIGATAAPMRWLIIYLPILPIGMALIASQLMIGHENQVTKLVALGIMGTLLINIIEPRSYYKDDQDYNPSYVLNAYDRLRGGGAKMHQIKALGVTVDPSAKEPNPTLSGNELFVSGISQIHCYNPSFGYRLERLPLADLGAWDVLKEKDGKLNIRNPACFVYPKENLCLPGDRFRVDQRGEAEAFVSYHPFHFIKSRRQIIADWITLVSLGIVSMMLIVVWPISILKNQFRKPAH